jgi:hypothetical protein
MVTLNTSIRFLRLKDAPNFFGVGQGFFNKFIRPALKEIWLGDTPQSGIVYDIYDLHAHADIMKERNGRPGKKGEGDIWDELKENQDCTSSRGKVPNSGKYKAQSSTSASEKVQEQITKMRQK